MRRLLDIELYGCQYIYIYFFLSTPEIKCENQHPLKCIMFVDYLTF